MKKLLSIFLVLIVMVSLAFFANISMASKAGTVTINKPCGITVPTQPTFYYNLNGANMCQLRVSTSSTLSTSTRDMNIVDGSTSQQLDVFLSPNTHYYWGIKTSAEAFSSVTVCDFTTN